MMTMRKASVAVALALALMVMSASLLPGAEAQPDCLTNGASALFSDATAVVQSLQTNPNQCCQTNPNGFCTVMLTVGTAAGTICGNVGTCAPCATIGADLNQVLAQCNNDNTIVGVYSPDGGTTLYYLTSSSDHP